MTEPAVLAAHAAIAPLQTRARIQLLHWRAGFGADPARIDTAVPHGYEAAVDAMLDFRATLVSPPALPPWPTSNPIIAGADEQAAYNKGRVALQVDTNKARSEGALQLRRWWADLLQTSAAPLQENLTLFWHDHFATSLDKVDRPVWMLRQNQLLRDRGTDKFADLLIAVSKDPAMLVWLDGQQNVKGHANENWSREVMELFTLGIGNYTEQDVREGARASTGYTVSYGYPMGAVTLVPSRFDNTPKTILGQTGMFNMDDFSRLLAGRPETARFISRKLFSWFVADNPTDAELAPMLDAWNTTGGDLRAVLRAMFLSDAFTPDRATQAHIKNPIAWTVGALRALNVSVTNDQLLAMFSAQAMDLFRPPNVGGWPRGPAWISPGGQVLLYNLAGQIVVRTSLSGKADDAFITDLADRLGGVPVPDGLRAKLRVLGDNADGKRAVAQVLLASPGYQTR